MKHSANERLIFGAWGEQAGRHRKLSDAGFRVLMMVAYHFDHNAQCQLSIEYLASELGISGSTIKRALSQAISTGFLARSKAGLGEPNVYTARLP